MGFRGSRVQIPASRPALAERLLLVATILLPLLLAPLPGGRFLLPALAPLTVYRPFSRRAREGDVYGAWKLAIAWAALLAVGTVALVYLAPAAAERGILNGETYRREMFDWIATGSGREGDWRAFVPQHLLHAAVFVVLTWASAGYLGLVMGAALMAYMSYFVASFGVQSGHAWLGPLAAWVPWSVVRIMAFVLLGALFARPLLVHRFWPFDGRDRALLLLALAGLLIDMVLKAALASVYAPFLRSLVYTAAP